MRTLLLALVLISSFTFGQNVTLDASKATITFDLSDEVEQGTLGGITIDSKLNLDDPSGSYIKASADVKTINTGVTERDEHLLQEDYFHAEKYPKLTFESKSIEKTESGYYAVGTLTFHGVSREVAMPFAKVDGKLVGRMKIHTGHWGIHEDAPQDPDAVNCIIRIQVPIK